MSEGSSSRRSLDGQVTVVTGAGRGIGRAVAEAFGAEGATVVCAARTASEIESTAAEIIAKGGRALAVVTDVGDADAVDRLYETSVKEFGGLDTLFLNAGESLDWQPIETSDPEKTKQMDSLVKARLLEKFSEPAIHVSRYTVTSAGTRFAPRFCYGHRDVTSIDSFTPIAVNDGFKETTVTYSYTMKEVPVWAVGHDVQAAFPEMARATTSQVTAKATLAQTPVGWQIPD